jgi:hypothetical protein
MREPIMRIYDAHRDLHHNMHVCPEADWVGCLISCMERDAVAQALVDSIWRADPEPSSGSVESRQTVAQVSTHYYGDHCYPPHQEMP